MTTQINKEILNNTSFLLFDFITQKNIVWDLDGNNKEISEEESRTIQRRAVKKKAEQRKRTKEKAEVFTPAWLCDAQNTVLDEALCVHKIHWKSYIDIKCLEISCGEAPYLVSRYDATTGKNIPIPKRIGLLDRKLRAIHENTRNESDWCTWAIRTVQSIYGFELYGDSLFLARVNIVATVAEYYEDRYKKSIDKKFLQEIACIVAQNIWQMDGLKCNRPLSDLHLDIVVGNPPYQKAGGSGGTNDAPIYQHFVYLAEKTGARYVSLLIPSRWFSSGRNVLLAHFRTYMLKHGHLAKLFVFFDASVIFPNVRIKSGLCYYLQDKNHTGTCQYYSIKDHQQEICERDLSKCDIIIRDPILAQIIEKVQRAEPNAQMVSTIISSDTPFGIGTNPTQSKKYPITIYDTPDKTHNTLLLYVEKGKRKISYIDRQIIIKNKKDIDKPKVFLPKASGTGNDPLVLRKPEILPGNSVCSQTFVYTAFANMDEAIHFVSYIKTKFCRALVAAVKISQHAPSSVYRYVPIQNFSKIWTDELLYKKYQLTEKEKIYIEKTIDCMKDEHIQLFQV